MRDVNQLLFCVFVVIQLANVHKRRSRICLHHKNMKIMKLLAMRCERNGMSRQRRYKDIPGRKRLDVFIAEFYQKRIKEITNISPARNLFPSHE